MVHQRMEEIGVRDLRASISEVVRRAGAGRRVVVTVDGRPVAQIGPLAPDDNERSLQDLVRRGALEGATDHRRSAPAFRAAGWPGMRTDRLIREVRGR